MTPFRKQVGDGPDSLSRASLDFGTKIMEDQVAAKSEHSSSSSGILHSPSSDSESPTSVLHARHAATASREGTPRSSTLPSYGSSPLVSVEMELIPSASVGLNGSRSRRNKLTPRSSSRTSNSSGHLDIDQVDMVAPDLVGQRTTSSKIRLTPRSSSTPSRGNQGNAPLDTARSHGLIDAGNTGGKSTSRIRRSLPGGSGPLPSTELVYQSFRSGGTEDAGARRFSWNMESSKRSSSSKTGTPKHSLGMEKEARKERKGSAGAAAARAKAAARPPAPVLAPYDQLVLQIRAQRMVFPDYSAEFAEAQKLRRAGLTAPIVPYSDASGRSFWSEDPELLPHLPCDPTKGAGEEGSAEPVRGLEGGPAELSAPASMKSMGSWNESAAIGVAPSPVRKPLMKAKSKPRGLFACFGSQ